MKRTGNIAINGELHYGTVHFAERIERIDIISSDPKAGQDTIIPGFVDVHVHGGGGADTMDGPDGVYTLARFHRSYGTTALLPTTITERTEAITTALHGVAEVQRAAPEHAATILGAHVEGPFINDQRLGAQPPFARAPDLTELATWLDTGVVRVMTLAPELPGAETVLPAFAEHSVRASIGHTNATYAEVTEFLGAACEHGVQTGFTHLYNAMTGLTHRAPGAVGAALTCPNSFGELILDLHHVHEAGALVAAQALGARFMLVTDAMRAAGQTSGTSELGGQTVHVANGTARLADGTLAGSMLTMWEAFQNAQRIGLTVAQASYAASSAPAQYLGLNDYGVIQNGARADLLVLHSDGSASAGYHNGREFTLAIRA